MYAICEQCETRFQADGRLFGFIPLVDPKNWEVELIGPDHERYDLNYGKTVECPNCGSKWKVFPHGRASCSGCLAMLLLFIIVPFGCLGVFFSELGAPENIVIGLATLSLLIGGILLIVFGANPRKMRRQDFTDQNADHTL
mgnify:CR=1 FL=1